MHIIRSIVLTTLMALGLTACTTAQLNQAAGVIEAVIDTALPIATSIGVAAAESYVADQVAQGNITAAQAAAINSALSQVATEVTTVTAKSGQKVYKWPTEADKAKAVRLAKIQLIGDKIK